MKKLFIWLGVMIVVLIALWFFYGKDNLGGLVAGEQYIYNGQASNVVSISYDGGTDEIILEGGNTATEHGLVVGDKVAFFTASAAFGGADAPGFTEATIYYVVTASTSVAFEISATYGGGVVDIAAAASASGGEFYQELIGGRAIDVSDGGKLELTLCGDATASASIQFVGSTLPAGPDFTIPRTLSNRWDTIAVYDIQNNTEAEGDTGIALALSAIDCTQYETYVAGLKWVSAITTRFGAGTIDLQVQKIK